MPPFGRPDAVSQPGLGVPPVGGGLVLALGIALALGSGTELDIAVALACGGRAVGGALAAGALMLAAADVLVAGADGALLACGLALEGAGGGARVLEADAAGPELAAPTAGAVPKLAGWSELELASLQPAPAETTSAAHSERGVSDLPRNLERAIILVGLNRNHFELDELPEIPEKPGMSSSFV